LHVVEGELDQARRKLPVIPGHQIVGTIDAIGEGVTEWRLGDRVGVAWLGGTDGNCKYCRSRRENLCERAAFTGWTVDGGYSEYTIARADFAYPLNETLEDAQVAPLLCAGIIGYRCLKKCNMRNWRGARLGIYGFGAAGHIAIQIARHRGAEVYVCTRDEKKHQTLAGELGAAWVGGATAQPPVKLDASIIFAPAGEIVAPALKALDRGGKLVLGGIHMSPIPHIEYDDLYWEREIGSVANNTRDDGREFLAEAASAGVKTRVTTYPLERVNDALFDLKHDAIKGAAVIVVG
jgi:propanol-preferring alcohol dehydrogenase